jgi:carbonic anhydrase/acetyltransferase-like protein (isoleucine patch superfamily)
LHIQLDGGVGDDLRVAAGDLTLRGFVIDHALIAGGNVTLTEDSAIGGRTWIGAGSLDLAGQVGDDLTVVAGTANLSGQVDGDVQVTARHIRVAPGAVISGALVWRSDNPPEIADDAQILGGVVAADELEELQPVRSVVRLSPVAMGLAWFIAAVALLWLRPGLVERSASAFRGAPGRTLVLGAAALVLVPLGALVLLVTVLGWLLGLLLLAGFAFALMLSSVLGLLIAMRLLTDRQGVPGGGPPVAGAAGGWRRVVALALLTAGAVAAQPVPLLGNVVNLLLLLAGLGALTTLATGRAGPASFPTTPAHA